ncbi:hypothetical protein Tco_1207809, partial [Tanacetum coccineum]
MTATGFEFKHDFTVIDSPRVVIFRDKYGVQMIMRFNEIHKFSDGTLHQIDEALDYRVKEFRINRTNPGMNARFWTKKDVDRIKILRVLRIILVVLPEHLSDTKVLTMKMEILLEPTSNKLLIDEALDYRVTEFRINKTNPGMNARFWMKKDVVRSKEFMFAIQKRLKTRRIFQNLENFVGGRIREGDYR